MTLNQLHYVITIAECGSMNKASEILYVAQPSLTSSIQELERELGITIFHRSGKGVTLTNDGTEFLSYAKEIYSQYEVVMDKYNGSSAIKKKFGVSTQHYSFAVKAFVGLMKSFDMKEYEFAIRETMTKDVINDVATQKSELGILYLSDFNRAAITKILSTNGLEFIKLIDCNAFVYLHKSHPLANNKTINFDQLAPYPCLSFEQGDTTSFYFAEEILSTYNYPRTIKCNDRATVLNLMIGVQGNT